MRARQLLPAALALIVLAVLAGCANGSGLRVEGAEPASTPTPSVTTHGFAPGKNDRTATTPVPVTASLAQIRLKLLADKKLEPFFRTVLTRCSVVERCLTRGPTVNVMRSEHPQIVVIIHTLDDFVYGAVLMAIEPSGPRPVWSLRGERLKINASQQGDLVVESGIFAVDDKPCCPSVTRVEVYRWNGRQMIKLSSQDQKGD
ncbi:hypothetical protein FB561_3483 [Kribbella amoyensis]|uniref:LppP/LprE lipoprotein n=1 Tax=Kribbella amoyensis TaxID=996641 RepID=A0A561BU84_9ACTN|nr:hypothetical protein [Kribbella amoyensis]TWD82353.1 hypothetical protein FB561_3483 [Kribbella amoyensis]